MADNYLERHYEEYEAKKAAWEKAKKLGKYKVKRTVKTQQEPVTNAGKTAEGTCSNS